jgi:hypothetical protein
MMDLVKYLIHQTIHTGEQPRQKPSRRTVNLIRLINFFALTTNFPFLSILVLFNTKNIPQLADYSSLNAIYQLFIHSTNSDLRSSIYNNDNDEYMPPPINLVVEDPMVQLSMDSGSLYPRLSSENISDDDGFGALRPAANSYLSWDLEDS